MKADVEKSEAGLRGSLRSTLVWARGRLDNAGLVEEQRLEAEALALDVELVILLYLGESVSCPGRPLEGERVWAEAADRLRRQFALADRLSGEGGAG